MRIIELLGSFFSFWATAKHIQRSRNYKKNKNYEYQRTRNLYDPNSIKSFKLSRSKFDLFLRCARCFYLDRRLGIGHPPGYPFTLNNAVDRLLKKEFDIYRSNQRPHPVCVENNIRAIPFRHNYLNRWRDSLHAGLQYLVPNTNLILYGGIDDVWTDMDTKELIVVEYKATSKTGSISLDSSWQISYKRQVEIYQWLLRRNGFCVSNTSYFVYCNGKTDVKFFNRKLNFDIFVIPYEGDDSWVSDAIFEAYKILQLSDIPLLSVNCSYCQYWNSINRYLKNSND